MRVRVWLEDNVWRWRVDYCGEFVGGTTTSRRVAWKFVRDSVYVLHKFVFAREIK